MAHRNIRLDDDLDKKVKAAADVGKVSYNEVIRLCVETLIDVVTEDYKRRNEVMESAKKAARDKMRGK